MDSTRTRIKICGITRPEDALHAARLGADAIGLVFFEDSRRCVGIEQARDIIDALPGFISTVGLFVNAEAAYVRQVIDNLPLDLLQFHGDENEPYCAAFSRPYIKALRVRPGLDVAEAMAAYPSARAILLDAWHARQAGGTGDRFDWRLIPRDRPRPLVLAGGLDAVNVTEAIEKVRPYAVDVSSGVEAEPGVKSREKMRRFVTAVNAAVSFYKE